MADSPQDYELFHYGVKGMKWGTRRSDAELANRAAKKTARSVDRAETYGKAAKRIMKRAPAPVIVSTLLAGPVAGFKIASLVGGYNISRSAGYKRGMSVAIGLLAGTPGGVLASEIKTRRRASQRVEQETS